MLPSGLPEDVADDEELARFLVQSNQFSSTSVKPSAFLPSPRDREPSVSRHGREPLQRLWELGLLAAGERPLRAAAFVRASDVRAAGLEVVADEPPERQRSDSWVAVDRVRPGAPEGATEGAGSSSG